MSNTPFPVHLRMIAGNSVYRILSETAFVEVQRIGQRYVVYDIVARTWPERLRIADMLADTDHSLVVIPESEFEDWRGRAGMS